MNGEMLENVKIEFITISKIFVANTLANGTFSLKLPAEAIDDDNVLRISFNEIKQTEEEKYRGSYETKDLIFCCKSFSSA